MTRHFKLNVGGNSQNKRGHPLILQPEDAHGEVGAEHQEERLWSSQSSSQPTKRDMLSTRLASCRLLTRSSGIWSSVSSRSITQLPVKPYRWSIWKRLLTLGSPECPCINPAHSWPSTLHLDSQLSCFYPPYSDTLLPFDLD
jgi:hypothetical protein